MKRGCCVDKQKLYMEKYQAWKEKRTSDPSEQKSRKTMEIKPREVTRCGDMKPSVTKHRHTVENKPFITSRANVFQKTYEVKRLGVRRSLGCKENSLAVKQTTIIKKESAPVKPKVRRSSLRLSRQSVHLQYKQTTSKLPLAENSTLKHARTAPRTSTQVQPVSRTSLHVQPVSRTSTQPVNRRPTQPVSRTSTQPVSRTSTQPVSRTSTQPVSRTSTQPVNRISTQPVSNQGVSTRPRQPLTTSSMFAIRQTKTSLARLFPNHKEEFFQNQQKWQLKKAEQNNRAGGQSKQGRQLQRAGGQSKQGRPLQRIEEPSKSTKYALNRRRTMPVADINIRKDKRYSVVQRRRSVNKTNPLVRGELEKWLISKGRTPSRCRHMSCYGHGDGGHSTDVTTSTTKRLLSIAELSSQQNALELEKGEDKLLEEMTRKLDPMLKECFDLLELGCPAHLLMSWLHNVEENLPLSRNSAEFWLCRAWVTLSTGDTDKVLENMEKAVQHVAKPSDVLAKGLTSLVKKMTETSYSYEGSDFDRTGSIGETSKMEVEGDSGVLHVAPLPVNIEHPSSMTETPALQKETVFQSSAIKLCVKERTPFLKRMADHETGGPYVVVTPVRRSTRRSLATIPGFLVDKDRLYSNVLEMPENDQHRSLYRENPAIPEDSLLQLQT